MDVNGNFESGISSMATLKEKSSNTQRRNTDHNSALTPKRATKSVVNKGFFCSTCTMEKKWLVLAWLNSLVDHSKGRSLILIEECQSFLSQLCLMIYDIIPFSGNQGVLNGISPLLLNLWYVWPILERLVGLREKSVNQEKTIIPYILLLGTLKFAVAEVCRKDHHVACVCGCMSVSKMPWICRNSISENGDKKNSKLVFSCY